MLDQDHVTESLQSLYEVDSITCAIAIVQLSELMLRKAELLPGLHG